MTISKLWTCLLAVAALPAAAQPLPLWEIGLAAGATSTPAYPGSDDRSARGGALPFLIYRGEVLRSDQHGIGARLFRSERAEFDVSFAGALPAPSKDVAARSGMPDLGALLEFGPQLKLKLSEPGAPAAWRVELPLRAVFEIRGGPQRRGVAAEPRLVYEWRGDQARWTFGANLGAVIGNAGLNNYYYEVRPEYATPERPAYHAQSGLILTRLGLNGSRAIGDDVRVFAFVRYESYANSANRDSPLLRRSSDGSAGVALTWTIRHSKARARD